MVNLAHDEGERPWLNLGDGRGKGRVIGIVFMLHYERGIRVFRVMIKAP